MSSKPVNAPVSLGIRVLFGAVLCCIAGCDQNTDPGDTPQPVAKGITAIVLDSASLSADGVSSTMVIAKVADTVARQTVTFNTTLGNFVVAAPPVSAGSQTTVNVDADHNASIQLRAPRQAGQAIITASVAGEVKTASVKFTTAYPDSMEVEPSSFRVKPGPDSSITVTARLRRIIGAVSPGAHVSFNARTVSGDSIGKFGIPNPSNDSGLATIRFVSFDTAYRGPIIITARTTGTSQKVLEAQTTVAAKP